SAAPKVPRRAVGGFPPVIAGRGGSRATGRFEPVAHGPHAASGELGQHLTDAATRHNYGEGGIRTPVGRIAQTGFRDRRIQPLCHLSRGQAPTKVAARGWWRWAGSAT